MWFRVTITGCTCPQTHLLIEQVVFIIRIVLSTYTFARILCFGSRPLPSTIIIFLSDSFTFPLFLQFLLFKLLCQELFDCLLTPTQMLTVSSYYFLCQDMMNKVLCTHYESPALERRRTSWRFQELPGTLNLKTNYVSHLPAHTCMV